MMQLVVDSLALSAADSLSNCALAGLVPQINVSMPESCISTASDIATVLIALANIVLIIILERRKKKDSSIEEEANRKIALLKTLILDYNLPLFYKSFERLNEVIGPLKEKGCDKKDVEKGIQSGFKDLNESFLTFFLAIDSGMHQSLIDISDKCRDSLVESIGDEGINLDVPKMFNEKIKKCLDECQRNILATLYHFNGK